MATGKIFQILYEKCQNCVISWYTKVLWLKYVKNLGDDFYDAENDLCLIKLHVMGCLNNDKEPWLWNKRWNLHYQTRHESYA